MLCVPALKMKKIRISFLQYNIVHLLILLSLLLFFRVEFLQAVADNNWR